MNTTVVIDLLIIYQLILMKKYFWIEKQNIPINKKNF